MRRKLGHVSRVPRPEALALAIPAISTSPISTVCPVRLAFARNSAAHSAPALSNVSMRWPYLDRIPAYIFDSRLRLSPCWKQPHTVLDLMYQDRRHPNVVPPRQEGHNPMVWNVPASALRLRSYPVRSRSLAFFVNERYGVGSSSGPELLDPCPAVRSLLAIGPGVCAPAFATVSQEVVSPPTPPPARLQRPSGCRCAAAPPSPKDAALPTAWPSPRQTVQTRLGPETRHASPPTKASYSPQ